MQFIIGLIIGMTLGAFWCFLAMATPVEEHLEACAKTHNVYKCELVAVPVAGESK